MKKRFYFLMLSCFLSMPLLGQSDMLSDDEITTRATQFMEATMASTDFSGNVLIMHGGKQVYQQNFGFANDAFEVPIDERTLFRIGSITKSFTAIGIMHLVRDGKLALDQSLQSIYPDYNQGDKITIKHLLMHGSGLPTDIDSLEHNSHQPFQRADITKIILQADLVFEPGTRFQYSNIGYFLLGDIIEKASGKPYHVFLKERIFDPLNMTDTQVDFPKKKIKNRAEGYSTGTWDESQNFTVKTVAQYIYTPNDLANGGLLSSQRDLYKLDRALYGNELLTAEEKQLMFQKQNGSYGLGWWIGNSLPVQYHSGAISGFTTSLFRSPENDLCIIVLSNYEDVNAQSLALSLTRMIFKGEYYQPQQKKMVEKDLSSLTQLEGRYNTQRFWFTLHLIDGKLWVVTPGDPYEELVPGEGHQFFSTLHDFSVNFDNEEYNSGFVQFMDNQWAFKRVKSGD